MHSVGYYFFGTLFGHVIARTRGVPHVSTPVYTVNPSSWQRRSFDAAAGRRLVRHADRVIAQSEHELQLMRADRFDVLSSTIVPFGVDSALFAEDYDVEDLRTRHAIGSNDTVLLFVGKVMSPKGASDCLEVVARLRSSGRAVRLIMIGEVHDRERETFAARIRTLGLDASVILLGAVTDRREIARYYQLSDAVLFPSQYEQFGIVAIEAAASGRPLLGYACRHHADPCAPLRVRSPSFVRRHRHVHAQRNRGARHTPLPGECSTLQAGHPFAVRLAHHLRGHRADLRAGGEEPPVSDAPNRPFGKYERFGAYHWREVQPVPTRHNAVLTARYRVLLDEIDPRSGACSTSAAATAR